MVYAIGHNDIQNQILGYVLHPIFNSWSDFSSISAQEMLDRYFEQLKKDIPEDVGKFLFMGFSMGGELSFRLAARLNKERNCSASVLACDAVINIDNTDFRKIPLPKYNGRMVLISAVKGTPDKEENEKMWQSYCKNLKIIRIDDTHEGLWETASHYELYKEQIDNLFSLF